MQTVHDIEVTLQRHTEQCYSFESPQDNTFCVRGLAEPRRASISGFGNILGSHLITKNARIPLSSTKKYFHGHTLFSRPFALPSTISRFSRFPRPFNVFPRPNAHFFTAKSCFHGHILIPRPNRFSKPFGQTAFGLLFRDQTAPQDGTSFSNRTERERLS